MLSVPFYLILTFHWSYCDHWLVAGYTKKMLLVLGFVCVAASAVTGLMFYWPDGAGKARERRIDEI